MRLKIKRLNPAVSLPEHRRYVLRAPIEATGLRGELGIELPGTSPRIDGSMWLVREGCLLTKLEIPWLFNIRQDPFEYYDQAPGPRATLTQGKQFVFHYGTDLIMAHLQSLQDFPPPQAGTSLSLADILEAVKRGQQ